MSTQAMEIIKKYDATEYRVGIYIIDEVEGKWEVSKGDTIIALFKDKHTALVWANIMYTCGNLVQEGTRSILKIMSEEREGKQ
jgi:hypothetical protein